MIQADILADCGVLNEEQGAEAVTNQISLFRDFYWNARQRSDLQLKQHFQIKLSESEVQLRSLSLNAPGTHQGVAGQRVRDRCVPHSGAAADEPKQSLQRPPQAGVPRLSLRVGCVSIAVRYVAIRCLAVRCVSSATRCARSLVRSLARRARPACAQAQWRVSC